jgi:hypothetical protein
VRDMEKPEVIAIRVEHIVDRYGVPDWLGEYSNEPKEGAIDVREKYGRDSNYLRYFNPENPEYAEQDLEEYEAFDRGEFCLMGVSAVVTLGLLWREVLFKEEIRSASLWGIVSTDETSLRSYGEDELFELEETVKTLGLEWPKDAATLALANPKIVE